MNNQFIKQLINNKFTTQSIVLLLSTVLSMIFTIGVNYLLTRILDPVQYGNYSYIINIFILAQTLFNFGYFYTICRLISLIDDRKIIREYYCVGLIIWLLLSIVMCVLLGIKKETSQVALARYIDDKKLLGNIRNGIFIPLKFSTILKETNTIWNEMLRDKSIGIK